MRDGGERKKGPIRGEGKWEQGVEEGGTKGRPHTIKLCSACAAEANSLFPASVKPFKYPLSASQQCRSIHLPLHPNHWKYACAPTKQIHVFVVKMKSINVVLLFCVIIQ